MNRKIAVILVFIFFFTIMPNTSYGIGEPNYRALIIGNGYYGFDNTLLGPPNDINKMENMLRHNYFGKDNRSFTTLTKKKDLTKSEIIHNIRENFKDTKEEDISYFYFSGHGYFDFYTNTSYIIGVDGQGLSVHELEAELRKIPGTVVIILDSCNSGGFINKGSAEIQNNNLLEEEYIEEDYTEEYNQSIINVFSQKNKRAYLLDNKYKVLTAASKNQYSYELEYLDGWGWGGEFTRAFVEGNGYNGNFLADANNDGDVSLQEIYYYAKNQVLYSNVQIYPTNDNFIIGSKYKENSMANIEFWDTFYNIPVNKSWNIKFNQKLDNFSWKNNIYILDSNHNKFPTKAVKNYDGTSINIGPLMDYDYNSVYTLVIDNNIFSEQGNKLKNKVLANFYTEEMTIDYQDICLDMVLNGYFNVHPYPSIKTAFENFFGYPTWEYFYSTDYEHVVEFNGIAYRNGIRGNFLIQFTVNPDEGSFYVNYAAFDYDTMTQYEFDRLLDAIYDNYFNPKSNVDLEDIFSNEENSPLLDNYKEK